MNRSVYLDGAFVPAGDAQISVYNGGWLHGAGLFETMRAERGRIFRLDRHVDRLVASAEKLLAPLDRAFLPDTNAWRRLLNDNGLTDARVRLTVTAGDMLGGVGNGRDRPLTVCATVAPLAAYPRELYEVGSTVAISNYRQSSTDPLIGHKTTNYLARLLAIKEANRSGCGEALWFTPDNLLAEGSISNVFVVRDGNVATPPLDTPVLPGIARAVVLELCAADSIKTAQEAININQLLDADEVFLTNSIMQVMPVCRVEKRDIGSGRPGPVAQGLLSRYREWVERECKTDG